VGIDGNNDGHDQASQQKKKSMNDSSDQKISFFTINRNLLEHPQVKAAALYASISMPLRKCLKFLLSR
jgi:hypothetical protein